MDVLDEAKVTVIVTPRERFGVARESLTSIFDHTTVPFDLIYVDAAGPKDLSAWVAGQARVRGFQHLNFSRVLTPNEARNAGLRRATTPYVVFIDNDVICSPNWLEPLIASAESTGADVVAPLTCQGLPVHTEVHQAGGLFTTDLARFFATPHGERIIEEVMHHQGQKVDDIPKEPVATQCCEFHCVLVRRSVFDRIGELDTEMLATKEHIDFCMSVLANGGTVMFEPRSVVTYLYPGRSRPIAASDWSFFLVRWSDAWQRRSFDRFRDKWGLKSDQPYFAKRARMLSWRYKEGVVKPIVMKLPGINRSPLLRKATGKLVAPFVSAAGAAMTARADRQRRLHPER
jgi:GT2 family glycosyltransferase